MRGLIFIGAVVVGFFLATILLAWPDFEPLAGAFATAAALTVVFVVTKLHETVALRRGLALDFGHVAEQLKLVLPNDYIDGSSQPAPSPWPPKSHRQCLEDLQLDGVRLTFYNANIEKLGYLPDYLQAKVMRTRNEFEKVRLQAHRLLTRPAEIGETEDDFTMEAHKLLMEVAKVQRLAQETSEAVTTNDRLKKLVGWHC